MLFDEINIFLSIILGGGIGLALGLLGGGGSILTVPALVYLLGQSPQTAVTTSLIIVGVNSGLGVFFHRLRGTLNLSVALSFGGAGMLTAYWAAGLSHLVSSEILLLLFALLMLVVGVLMILRRKNEARTQQHHNWVVVFVSGALVGVLTGFLGVGGGFLIVPTLVLLLGLPMPQAVGTSLLIIAMNSFAGLLGHLNDAAVDYRTTGIFVVAGLAGMFLGTRFNQQIDASLLRRLFGLFVIVLALFLLYDSLSPLPF